MLVSLTVGKVDAGVTVLLTPDKRLIEFPSILLPPDISSGSIVDITVARNTASESAAERAFRALQDQIFSAFGAAEPAAPVLRCRNATQTSVVLEWDPIQLATADLISLALFRNGQKAGNIPRPTAMHSTKISGLAVDTEYAFHLVLRTTAGTLTSERVVVRTHKMTDLSGITITTGILPAAARDGLARAVERIGAKLVDGVRIDTTHFVTTEGRGIMWEKANELNIPVVRPEWVDACEKNGRILGVTKFYLDAVRTGPPATDERPAAAAAAAAAAPPQTHKDLPPEPPTNGGSGGGSQALSPQEAAGYAAARKEESVEGEGEEEEEESEVESDESDEVEEKVRSGAQDEQKVRVEERDQQGLAARPKPVAVEDAGEEEDDDEQHHRGRKSEENLAAKGGKSPGDGASFQDVAL
ncbi:BRCA1 C terminus domain-containing protein [Cercophora scortea]|uniref:BRCA1 C terminus domain-containing protein n=1 Tax=Cercophora scortea TaxID=314031 RepID=A0AAE0J3Q3_9PEZI|nr:BRCA1 C terminus domain-containing protein [Cercophora scortea]